MKDSDVRAALVLLGFVEKDIRPFPYTWEYLTKGCCVKYFEPYEPWAYTLLKKSSEQAINWYNAEELLTKLEEVV